MKHRAITIILVAFVVLAIVAIAALSVIEVGVAAHPDQARLETGSPALGPPVVGLDPDGTLHYASRAKDNGVWSGLHYSVATSLLDGRWHHVAASRTPPTSAAANATDRVLIYIDGVLVTATRGTAPEAPAATCTGLKVFIGASAAADLSATRPFHGMIAEVRVWDTYLVAGEITARMHVKLRGDEPDLIAYWNFDHGTVHDGAVQGHDGVLAQPVTHPVWWMTDLPFTQPAYPQITSSARITAAPMPSLSRTTVPMV